MAWAAGAGRAVVGAILGVSTAGPTRRAMLVVPAAGRPATAGASSALVANARPEIVRWRRSLMVVWPTALTLWGRRTKSAVFVVRRPADGRPVATIRTEVFDDSRDVLSLIARQAQ